MLFLDQLEVLFSSKVVQSVYHNVIVLNTSCCEFCLHMLKINKGQIVQIINITTHFHGND